MRAGAYGLSPIGGFSSSTGSNLNISGEKGFYGLEIPKDRIVIERPLGDHENVGNFGVVYKGTCFGLDVAIKVPKFNITEPKKIALFKEEVKIMSQIHHPNVCRFIGACLQPGNFYLVTEFCPRGNLLNLLRSNVSLTLYQRMKMASGFAKGMIVIQEQNIVHSDLKPENLLLDDQNDIKITDFGFAKFREPNKELKGRPGSFLWMAPEKMLEGKFDQKSDVYSFGIILWQLVTRQDPFPNHSSKTEFVKAVGTGGERPPIPSDCPPRLRDLMERSWHADSRLRPNFIEIDNILNIVLIETAIQDPWGRQLWLDKFRAKGKVKWEEFELSFYQSLGMPDGPPSEAKCHEVSQSLGASPSQVDLQKMYEINRILLQNRCLKVLLADKTLHSNPPEFVVDIEKFGGLCHLYGPVVPANFDLHTISSCSLPFLQRIESMLRSVWFYGYMTKEEAESKLLDKDEGTFLVRISGTSSEPAFCISFVAQGRVVHVRAYRDQTSGFHMIGCSEYYATMEYLIAANSNGPLRTPIPAEHRFKDVIATRINVSSIGYFGEQ